MFIIYYTTTTSGSKYILYVVMYDKFKIQKCNVFKLYCTMTTRNMKLLSKE